MCRTTLTRCYVNFMLQLKQEITSVFKEFSQLHMLLLRLFLLIWRILLNVVDIFGRIFGWKWKKGGKIIFISLEFGKKNLVLAVASGFTHEMQFSFFRVLVNTQFLKEKQKSDILCR
jgi:hypothetical protein